MLDIPSQSEISFRLRHFNAINTRRSLLMPFEWRLSFPLVCLREKRKGTTDRGKKFLLSVPIDDFTASYRSSRNANIFRKNQSSTTDAIYLAFAIGF